MSGEAGPTTASGVAANGTRLAGELGPHDGAAAVTPPILVFGWGNPSRGDDALGPLLIDALQAMLPALQPASLASQVTLLTDFQLQIEHALDLVGRQRVLLVDAALGLEQPMTCSAIQASKTAHQGSHALSPQALLQVYEDIHDQPAPPCTLLAIRGQAFGLGEPLSAQAQQDLAVAVDWVVRWLQGAG